MTRYVAAYRQENNQNRLEEKLYCTSLLLSYQ